MNPLLPKNVKYCNGCLKGTRPTSLKTVSNMSSDIGFSAIVSGIKDKTHSFLMILSRI